MDGRRRRSIVRRIGALAMAASAAVAMASIASGQEAEAPSAEKGLALAQRFCKGCHVVEGGGDASVPAGVPSLRGLANKPDQSGERIRNVLISPHAPMPDIHLSNQEILDLIAYLDTLRADRAGTPFLTPAQRSPKPAYPQPS